MTLNATADTPGNKAYGWRSEAAGSALAVSFSSRRPPAAVAPGAVALNFITSQGPLRSARPTSLFGATRSDGGGGTRAHLGVDLAAPLGSPVAATQSGTVSSANWAGNYGLLVTIDHGSGVQTRYAHLSSVAVTPGQFVMKGQVIGLVGSTGHSTGPHLHYELRQNGHALNPLAR